MLMEFQFEQLPKGVQNMIKLKSALWTNGNIEKFITEASTAYKKDIPLHDECCFECGAKAREVLADYKVSDGRHIVFQHVPTMICPNCGNQEWDLQTLASLDEIALTLPENTTMALEQALEL